MAVSSFDSTRPTTGLTPPQYDRLFDQELEKVVRRTRDPACRQAH